MKKIFSILSAGLVALAAVSCVQEKMTVFDPAKATAPVLASYEVTDAGITATYNPGSFNQNFNTNMPVNHSLVITSVNGASANKMVSATFKDGTVTASVANISKALMALGCAEESYASFDMVIRASMQEVSKDNGLNGHVDSDGKISVSDFFVKVPEVKGNPWKDYTENSPWSLIGSIASTGNSWNKDEPGYMVTDGNKHVVMKITLTPDDQFKFRKDGGWDTNFGAPGDTEPFVMTVGEAIEATPNGKNLTVDAEGQYDILLDETAGTITIYEAFQTYPGFDEISNWSVIGSIASFDMSWNKDIQMTTDGEWHVAEGVVLSKDDQFKFRMDLDWTTNIGAAGDTEPFVVSLDEEYSGANGGKNLAVPADGTYDLLCNPSTNAFKIVESLGGKSPLVGEDKPEPVGPTAWSLIGTLDGSSWDKDFDLSVMEGTLWVYRGIKVTASDEFKIRADHKWDTNFGGPEGNSQSTIDPANPYEVYKPEIGKAFEAGDKNIQIGQEGTFDVYFDAETHAFTISEHVPYYSLIGNVNGSSWDKDILMRPTASDEKVWSSGPVTINGEFKIRYDFSWDAANTYGQAEKGAETKVGEAFTLVQPGENMKLAEGVYKVQFTPSTLEVLITEVKYPEHLYMIGGDFGGWDWASDGIVELTPVLHNPAWGAEAEGQFYTIRYFTTNGFKLNGAKAWDGGQFGKLDNNYGFTNDGDGNVIVPEEGFYIVHVDLKNGNMNVEPAKVYGIGEAFGGWDEAKEENLFKADGKVLKATTSKAGALRMYVASQIATSGWWTREFNIIDGVITPRLMDELAAPQVLAGQVVTLDFNAGTGTITGEGEAPAYKTEISVPGAYSGSEWDLGKAPKLYGKADGIFKGALDMYKTGEATKVEFKFGHDGSWIGGTAGEGLAFTLGADSNLSVEDGSYFWTVDLEKKTATAVKITKVALIGSFNEWKDDTEVQLTFDAESCSYSGSVTLPADAQLKVRFNTNWDYCLGGELTKLSGVADNIKVAEAGTYNVKLELNKGTLTLTK